MNLRNKSTQDILKGFNFKNLLNRHAHRKNFKIERFRFVINSKIRIILVFILTGPRLNIQVLFILLTNYLPIKTVSLIHPEEHQAYLG